MRTKSTILSLMCGLRNKGLFILLKGWRRLANKDGIFLFHDTLNTFFLRLHGIGHMVKEHSENERKSAGTNTWYMHHLKQDSTYHGLCYCHGTLAGTRNSSIGPP